MPHDDDDARPEDDSLRESSSSVASALPSATGELPKPEMGDSEYCDEHPAC